MPNAGIKQNYTFEDKKLNLEFQNLYRSINRIINGELISADKVAKKLADKIDRRLDVKERLDWSHWGEGTPEEVLTALPGHIYHRTDGVIGGAVYAKERGTGNTGWRSVTNGYTSVIDTGAVGDGSTDDSTAVQDAIDQVETDGKGVVYFPPGSYRLSASVVVTSGNVGLVFATGAVITIDEGYTLTVPSPGQISAGDDQVIFDDDNSDHEGVVFSNPGRMSLGWWGTSTAALFTAAWQSMCYTVSVAGGGWVYIPPGSYTLNDWTSTDATPPYYNYIISGTRGVVIDAWGVTVTHASGLSDPGPLVFFINCDDIVIKGIEYDGLVGTNGAVGNHGIHLQSCRQVIIDTVNIHDFYYDCLVLTDDDTHGPCENVHVRSSTFASGQRDCVTCSSVRNAVFESCIIKDAADNATYRNANYCNVVFEAHDSDDLVENVVFRSCKIYNGYGANVRATDNDGTVRDVTFENCHIQMDLDEAESSVIVLEGDSLGTIEGFTFRGCRLHGCCKITSQAIFDGCRFINDTSVTGGGGAGHQCLHFYASAKHGCAVRGCQFEISGNASKRFIVLSDRNGNSESWTLPITGNTFTTSGTVISGQNLFDPGNLYASGNDVDLIIWEHNKFRHEGSSPATPNYIAVPYYSRQIIMDVGNSFCDDLRLGASGVTGLTGRLPAAIPAIKFSRQTMVLSSSGTWSSAISSKDIVLGISARVISAITISGGTAWRVGDGSNVDRWGTATTNLAVDAQRASPDWDGTDTPPFEASAGLNIVITPDSGSFTAGVVEIIVMYIRFEH